MCGLIDAYIYSVYQQSYNLAYEMAKKLKKPINAN